jgi:hypothetical protein
MGKIFRLHTGALNTITHWGTSALIGTNSINTINDPNIQNIKKEITSIPSPFARIDLVKQAFKYVNANGLDGNTQYHKLVSDTLDVAEIFFNIDKYNGIIDIIEWDKAKEINNLCNSQDSDHKRFGETLNLYMLQNPKVFANMNNIYLLNYIDSNAPHPMNIIGATSPSTLYFTSANKLDFVSNKITFGLDKPFDSNFRPLFGRDPAFIEYLWAMEKANKNFNNFFPEFYTYLQNTYSNPNLDPSIKGSLNAINNSNYGNNYDDITINGQNKLDVLGIPLKKRNSNSTFIQGNSGFVVAATQKINAPIPLALPVNQFSSNIQYVTAFWDKNTKAPLSDVTPISNRTLPFDGSKYPYLTIGDFLNDTIIKVGFNLNDKFFFDGNLTKMDEKVPSAYLLPLSKHFFEYFGVDDLKKNYPTGEKYFEINELAGGAVRVTLRVPIKNDQFVEYERIYNPNTANSSLNKGSNKGTIVNREITLGIFPFIKYPTGVSPQYCVSLMDRDSVSNKNTTLKLTMYNASDINALGTSEIYRNRNADGSRFDNLSIDEINYIVKDSFDHIFVEDSSDANLLGVIIPEFQDKHGACAFQFAIDFGTTNTHIEYLNKTQAAGTLHPFDINANDIQLVKFHSNKDEDNEDNEMKKSFIADFIPDKIGPGCDYSFPIRTALSESINVNWNTPVRPMGQTNIPFAYDKKRTLRYNKIVQDLKWSSNSDDQKRSINYIKCLLLLIRNKVLLNNGDLKKTEIVWFFPASMTKKRFDDFESEWKNEFIQLFGAPENNIKVMSESSAPYYYNKNTQGATSTTVSVDIGGGTTDVLFADSDGPKYLTSFRFAANSIFGDGYGFNSDSNGMVRKYSEVIEKKLMANKVGDFVDIMTDIKSTKKSSEIFAFFFSLAENKVLKDKNIDINFGKMISNDGRVKYIVLLFYIAIIYHIASIMRVKNMRNPRNISFSGNGAKVLKILTSSTRTLEEFSKLIFKKVGSEYDENGLTINCPNESKECTCRGGLQQGAPAESYSSISDKKIVLLGKDDETLVDSTVTYDSIDDNLKSGCVTEVKKFLDFAFALNSDFNFHNNFGIDTNIVDGVKKICSRDIEQYLKSGIEMKQQILKNEGAGTNSELEETLFFYPLVGILNAIAREVYEL